MAGGAFAYTWHDYIKSLHGDKISFSFRNKMTRENRK
jgi:hypothetical protein